MLAIKKRAPGKIVLVIVLILVALILITITLGKKIHAYYEESQEEETKTATAASLAAHIQNTQPAIMLTSLPAMDADSPVTRRKLAKITNIAHSTVYKQTDTLEIGEELTIQEGDDGGAVREYIYTYIDDILKTVEMTTETVYPPEDEVILIGTYDRNLPENMISELEIPDWFALDENGVPTSYTSVLTGKGVAYSARPGAKTASGRVAMPGYVAVDPSIIPYGTKMYIASTDNKHIYGYAIAADTGTGLLEGLCLVDLFMGSYEESCEWGAHQVNIYILE
jgi:3D (Asp-Asp-Asp) domain-containing protein